MILSVESSDRCHLMHRLSEDVVRVMNNINIEFMNPGIVFYRSCPTANNDNQE